MKKVRNLVYIVAIGMILLATPSYCSDLAFINNPVVISNADEKLLRSQVEDYAKDYASGDAKAIANMWTSDGTYTLANGLELHGRSEIEKYFAAGFKQFGAQPLKVSVESINFPTSDVAIEEGSCRVLKGTASDIQSRYTVVHVKQNGQWLMVAVTESEGLQKTSGEGLKDLGWLIGSWTAKVPRGTMHLKAEWAGDGKFIHCTYRANDLATEKPEQMQIIGWDPQSRQIRSWHFGSNGGFGCGRWLRDDQSFIESTNGIEPDGTASSSINTLHKLGDNSFTWQSTGRILGNGNLPDTPEITATRDQ